MQVRRSSPSERLGHIPSPKILYVLSLLLLLLLLVLLSPLLHLLHLVRPSEPNPHLCTAGNCSSSFLKQELVHLNIIPPRIARHLYPLLFFLCASFLLSFPSLLPPLYFHLPLLSSSPSSLPLSPLYKPGSPANSISSTTKEQ